MAAPLNNSLMKEVPWTWTAECHQAVETLKECLLTSPVLALPDPTRPYVVASDASKVAIGGVLLQDFGQGLQPIEYFSRMHDDLGGAQLPRPPAGVTCCGLLLL